MEINAVDLNNVKVKRVIICCNGFINLKKHALAVFKEYFDQVGHDENHEVKLINLYDPDDKKTYNRKKQINVLAVLNMTLKALFLRGRELVK